MKIRAPGRICLFGEHQDYLGFPIIAAAIDRYIFIESEPLDDTIFKITMPDIERIDELPLFSEIDLEYRSSRDYLRSCYNLLRRRNFNWKNNSGFNIKLTGNIPVNAGASSSSAMVIAWLNYLTKAANESLNAEEIAELGYHGEVAEFGEAGGMMDHFASSLGGLIFMETAPAFKPRKIANYSSSFKKSFILINSNQRKDTVGDLARVKSTALEGFSNIKMLYPSFDKYTTKIEEIQPYLDSLNYNIRDNLLGNLSNRDITSNAYRILQEAEKNTLTEDKKKEFGELLYHHHKNLSEKVKVSTEKIDKILDLVMEFGAFGGKINGSGFGGTCFVYCPKNRDEIKSLLDTEGIENYLIEISEGAGEY